MKIKGRDSGAWHKNINDTVGPRRPTDTDFPWLALRNHTGYYIKKKGKLSQIQIDERLLALIQSHPSKEVAIAACADKLSTRVIRNLLVNDLKVEPDGTLAVQEYLQVILATNHEDSGAVSEVEAQWAKCLLEHTSAGGSLGQQLHDVLSLLPARVAPDLLLYKDIKRLADSICTEFAKQLQDLRHSNRWMDAHAAVGWLSTASTSRNTLQTMSSGARLLIEDYLPCWGAWAAWRPHIPRLRAWKDSTTFAYPYLEDLLALEGPDFASIKGSEEVTLREGLIAQGSRGSQSTLQWGKTHASFNRNPFIQSENLKGILGRLTCVMDFAFSAGPEYTALLEHLYRDKTISNEVLQLLEGVQFLDNPIFTAVILNAFTVPKQNVGQIICDIRQLLPALNDARIFGLRQQMQPYLAYQISRHVRELQNTLLIQIDEGSDWLDATAELLIFTYGLQEQTWLLAELDHSVQLFIASPPFLMTMETLGAVRNSLRSTTTSTPTPLLSQIDAYCKAQLIPGCIIDPKVLGLVEALIRFWQQDADRNHRELALLIADLPHTGCQFRCDCLTDISILSNFWVISTLRAFKFRNGSPELGCIALIRLLVSETSTEITERWRKVLSFAIEKQHETLLRYAVTHLTTSMWLELLSNIKVVYKEFEVTSDRRSLKLLSLELHTWSQQIADHLPTLTRLESVLKHGPAMQVLLLGITASKNYQLLRVLGLVTDSKSSYHTKVMDNIIALLHSENADEIEDSLSVVSKARLKGAEACLRVLDSRGQIHPELATVELALSLRASDLSGPDHLALRKVAILFGIDLDSDGFPSAAGLKLAADSVHKRYLKLITEAQRLENLRLSLQAVAPASVSKLLVRLHIEAPSVVDDALATLPPSLGSLVEKISKNELELQFPATELTRLQRFAIGAGDAESFLIRLTLRQNGAPVKFCIHLSAESSDQTEDHTPWQVFRGNLRGNNRPPHEQYCHGRPNLGIYQLSRILWHHLRHNFQSLEQTHTHMTSKISKLGQGCAVCGSGTRHLRRATICSSPSCQSTFLKAPIEIQLAEIWQDPPVMDLLLSMFHATASTGKLDLLTNCPASNAPDVTSMFDGLPEIPNLAKHLKACLNVHEKDFRLPQAVVGYCTQSNCSETLAKALLWACLSYRGFLVSATELQRIPSFGSNQFLLANTAPELETAFSRHAPTPRSESHILFHGTCLDRLHAILCQGLRVQSGTALQRHGAAHGAGIYMVDEPSVAWGYATVSTGGWRSSKLKNQQLLLGCELAGPKPQAVRGGIYVITDATRLAVRYVFLLGSDARMPAAKDVGIPMQSVFQSLRSNTL
ncbi:MAG: hypothetical protein Q9161_006745 [Pseudevernia consocians]